jgi:UDP-N-acetylmuramoyl-L-alanyl-D-glutamate--2,6-diaminopimelate ligase
MNDIFFKKTLKVTDHTDYVGKNSVFFAFSGKEFNGVDFIELAISKGAKTVVVSENTLIKEDLKDLIKKNNVNLIFSKDLSKDFSIYSINTYNKPHEKLKIIAVTGTKGKSSTAIICAELLKSLGFKVGLITTIYNMIDSEKFKAPLTTPKSYYINAFLDECLKNNITHVVIEVSAQAVSLNRVYGIEFDSIIFSNISQEHAEFYETQDDYYVSKCNLLKQIKNNGTIILNSNDKKVKDSLGLVKIEKKHKVIFFGANKNCDLFYNILETTVLKTKSNVIYKNYNFLIDTNLFAEHSISNISSAILAIEGVIDKDKFDINIILNKIKNFDNIPGRFEKYFLSTKNITVCIDKAHTPSSYEAILGSLRNQTNNLIVVFGCGGEKDKIKRPLIANICEKYCDEIFLTTDNPRNEDLKNIFIDILYGFSFEKKINIIKDRKECILKAIELASFNSIIAILGKGDEEYQIIGNKKIPFSDKEIINNFLID